MTAVLTIVTAYVGIDVAKTKLDVVLRLGERAIHQVFANTAEGFTALDASLALLWARPCPGAHLPGSHRQLFGCAGP